MWLFLLFLFFLWSFICFFRKNKILLCILWNSWSSFLHFHDLGWIQECFGILPSDIILKNSYHFGITVLLNTNSVLFKEKVENMNGKIVLIDGHSILNRAFYGLPDLTNSEGLHTNAVYGFLNILFKILDEEKYTLGFWKTLDKVIIMI